MKTSENAKMLQQLKQAVVLGYEEELKLVPRLPGQEDLATFAKRVESYSWGKRGGLIAALRDFNTMMKYEDPEILSQYRKCLRDEHGIWIERLIDSDSKLLKAIR